MYKRRLILTWFSIIFVFLAAISNFARGEGAFLFYILTAPLWIVIILLMILLKFRNSKGTKLFIIFSCINIFLISINLLWIYTAANANIYRFGTFILISSSINLLLLINEFFHAKKLIAGGAIILLLFTGGFIPLRLMCQANEFKFRLNEDNSSYTLVHNYKEGRIVTIPTHYKGLPVSKIISGNDGHTLYWQNISEIRFQENSNIKEIERGAFASSDVKRIILPDGLESIGSSAFANCRNLREVYIPKSVLTIGFWAFKDLKNITIYCEAESKPEGWHNDWQSINANVEIIWGYKK